MDREFFPQRRVLAAVVPAYHASMKTQLVRSLPSRSLWRDLFLALVVAVVAALLAAQVELQEQLFAATRRFEHFELDEWPTALLVFTLCMVVLYARRHAQLRRALAENRHLVGRLLAVQEEERRRLARELHDELGQTLNAIKLDVLALPDVDAAQRIASSADRVYGAAGDLVRSLRPPALDELGLSAAIEACVDRWRRSHPGLSVQLSMAGALDSLGEAVSLGVYRIVQEALTNCVRHAGARHFYIDLTRAEGADGGVSLEMHDDGKGMAEGGERTIGSGLAGMRERVGLLDGQFELLSAPGEGVTIRVEIPPRREKE
jgi:signal transduction histidine kinase